MSLVGTWYIYKMEMWDKDYFNMEVQAYIKVGKNRILPGKLEKLKKYF